MNFLFSVCLLFVISLKCCASVLNKQNIVFIVADDLGWNDVSFLGSEDIQTPNLDVLANSGVVLHRYYTHAVCTPSRAAIMTGKFAFRTGMQGYPLTNAEPRGLPLSEKLLPEYLKELGYATHLVGKWHLGHHKYAYLPTFRGFDSHFGHRGGFLDYYEYTSEEHWISGDVSGLALFRNVTPVWDAEGYITDLYTSEATNIIAAHDASAPLFLMVCHNAPHAGNDAANLQAPPEEVRRQRHIPLPGRRLYAAMVKKLDDSVGDIVEALNNNNLLNNTIIVFISDNGGAAKGITLNWSSNKPLRGTKMTPWDGGLRAAAALWSMDLAKTKKGNVWKGYIHGVDWLPTLLGAIGADNKLNIDGINLWNNIIKNKKSDRKEIVEIDDSTGYAGIINGDYKLVTYDDETFNDDVYGQEFLVKGEIPSYMNALTNSKTFFNLKSLDINMDVNAFKVRDESKLNCGNKIDNGCDASYGKACLYDIIEDPCEMEDISTNKPEVADKLGRKLKIWMNQRVPRNGTFRDPQGSPEKFNYTWASWEEPIEILEV